MYHTSNPSLEREKRYTLCSKPVLCKEFQPLTPYSQIITAPAFSLHIPLIITHKNSKPAILFIRLGQVVQASSRPSSLSSDSKASLYTLTPGRTIKGIQC